MAIEERLHGAPVLEHFRTLPMIPAAVSLLAWSALGAASFGTADAPKVQTYRVRQTVTLAEVDPAAKQVRWWISIPADDRAQEVLDMRVVSAPGKWSIEREAEFGNRFLYVDVQEPRRDSLEAVVEFTLRRRALDFEIDPQKVGALSDAERSLYVDELRTDAPHMQVDEEIRAMADQACGDERNIALAAAKLLDHVAKSADHYSKDPTKPTCGVGDAMNCIQQGGGCCTDLHSLFIALARARGIPARLQMGYRLLAKNADKEVDPGYRCWPEYFVPGYGWVPADIVEADAATPEDRTSWFSGLSERRLWLNQGREFNLEPKQAGPRVNTMIIGYAEVDGRAVRLLPEGDRKAQQSRRVHFIEVAPAACAALSPPRS